MATYCVRRYLSLLKGRVSLGWQKRKFADSARSDEAPDPTAVVTDLCRSRHFITGEQVEKDSLLAGWHGYGPLGMVLRRNLAEQWWRSMTTSRGQVFGLSTLHQAGSGGRKALKLVDGEALAVILKEKGQSVEQLTAEVERLLRASASLRTELLQGALEQYAHSLSLVNRRLPFGLAEMGVCYQPAAPDSEGTTRTGEAMLASLVWFSSPRTAGQWLDFWVRHRLQWWRKFATGASNFSSSDFQDECGTKGTRLYYSFPWGREPIETLQSLGDRELLETHQNNIFKLVGMKLLQAREDILSQHYHDLHKKPFYPNLLRYMSSGPVVAMVWEGHNVVRTSRLMVGNTNPAEAYPGTIRGDYSVHISRNVIHASDSVEGAQREIHLWFDRRELVDWDCCDHSSYYQV